MAGIVSKQKLDEVYSIVTGMHDTGEMTDSLYMKSMLTLAADWAVLGEFAECMMCFCKIDRDYVLGDLVAHMESDQTFATLVHGLARRLVNAGMASSDPIDTDALMLSVAKPAQA